MKEVGICPRPQNPDCRYDQRENDHQTAVADHAADEGRVAPLDRVVDVVERSVEDVALFGRDRSPEPQGALGRLQGRRVDRADEGGRGDDEGELGEHVAGEARHESGRNEHRHQDQRDADDRPEQFVHRRIAASCARHPLLDVFRHALDDHDRVVDHDADREHDAEQGREIDGEAQRRHAREGADDGDRHGRGRHQRRAEVLQEDEDDDQHEDAGLEQRLVDLGDRVLDEDRRVVGDGVLQAFGKALGHRGHRVFHLLADLQRVGVGRLIDPDARGGLSVDAEVLRIGLRAEFDPGDVAQVDEPAALRGLRP